MKNKNEKTSIRRALELVKQGTYTIPDDIEELEKQLIPLFEKIYNEIIRESLK